MSPPREPNTPTPRHVHTQAAAMLSIVEEIARAYRIGFDPEQTLAVFESGLAGGAGDSRDPLGVLEQSARTLGISCTPLHRTPREIVEEASRLAPLLAHAPQVTGGIVAITGRRGRSARVITDPAQGTAAWLRPAELAALLGASDEDAPLRVLTCEPTLPLASAAAGPASAPPGGHGAQGHGSQGHGGSHHGAHGHGLPPVRRLFALLKLERNDLAVVGIYAISVGVLALATPLAVQALVNNVAFATALQPVVVLSAVVVIALGLAGILRVLQLYVIENLQRRTMIRVIADLSYRLPRVQMSAFDRQDGRKLVNRFFDVLTVQKAASTLLLDGLSLFLELSVGLVILAFYSPMLMALSLCLFASLAFIVFGLGRGAVSSAVAESYAKHEAAGWLEELAQHPTLFRGEAGQDLARSHADSLAREYLASRRSHFAVLVRQYVGTFALQAVASAALLGVGGFLVINRQLTLGQLVASEIILSLVVVSLSKLGKHLEVFYDLLAALDKLGHLLDLPMEREGGEELPLSAQGLSIHVRDLAFGHRKSGPTLRIRDLRLAPGDRLAVLGGGASGKTTLVDLLLGLREPSHGRIEVEGLDLRDVALASYRNHVAAVRGAEIFEGSIVDNVRMGRPWIRLSEVRRALAAVGLLDEVAELPEGVHTELLSSGAPLSAGQAARLMLAQAIVGQPRLLLLDETLDFVEPDYRARVAATIFAKDAPWTLVLTTDFAETARTCERVLQLKDASIVAASDLPTPGGER